MYDIGTLYQAESVDHACRLLLEHPEAQVLAGGSDALDEKSTWLPVVKGWTSTRDFELLSENRFSTWLKEHNAQNAAGALNEQNAEGGER